MSDISVHWLESNCAGWCTMASRHYPWHEDRYRKDDAIHAHIVDCYHCFGCIIPWHDAVEQTMVIWWIIRER